MTASPRRSSALSPADALSCDDDSQYLPWQIAFRVQFPSDKLGLRFHPAQFPDTGNGIYTIRLLELTKGPGGDGPAQHYNSCLQPGQKHLTLRPGLYLTHINDIHLVEVSCEEIIESLQKTPRPVTLRFIDVEAGVVTRHELQDKLGLDGEALSDAIASMPRSAHSSPRRPSKTPMDQTEATMYKIILLGTAGVGKSSLLAVAVNGDDAYSEHRPPTLEAEFGSLEFPDPNDSTGAARIKTRIWDTAGQERFRAITRSHYRRADGALLVYDVSDGESFERLGEWLRTLRETTDDSLSAVMVVENKVDTLPKKTSAPRPPDFAQIDRVQSFCKAEGLLFVRTTAKLNGQASEWDGAVTAANAVKQLVRSIHATRTGSNTIPSKKDENVVLSAKTSTSIGEFGDCGGCNFN